LLKQQGVDVGVMKPVQCSGHDAQFLRKSLNLQDPIEKINPYFAPEPLSPHLAFSRQKKSINVGNIKKIYQQLAAQHDLMLVEGAGGLMVPLKEDYLVADLIKDFDLDVVIVARLGLGTINHTLLTISQAREMGLNVKGVVFSETEKGGKGIPEKTNPDVIQKYGKVRVLGTIPYLSDVRPAAIRKICSSKINVQPLIAAASKRNRIKQFVDWDKKYLWHPFTQMQDWLAEEPLIIDQAKGSYLIDTKGNRYLDGVSSLWVNVHGHGQKTIDRALKAQVNRLSHSTLLGLSMGSLRQRSRRLLSLLRYHIVQCRMVCAMRYNRLS